MISGRLYHLGKSNSTTFGSPGSIWDDPSTKNGIIYKAENHEVPLCPLPRNQFQLPGSLKVQTVPL